MRLFEDKEMSHDLAEYIDRMQFPRSDIERMDSLSAKAREGSLTAAEDEELENYLFVAGLLAILQSKARRRLNQSGER
jgi:hypothetical protein